MASEVALFMILEGINICNFPDYFVYWEIVWGDWLCGKVALLDIVIIVEPLLSVDCVMDTTLNTLQVI